MPVESAIAHLEALVLEDSLDSGILAAGGHLGLKHHAEGTIANDLALGVGDLLVLASQAILDLFTDDLYSGGGVSGTRQLGGEEGVSYHPCANSGTSPADSVTWWEGGGLMLEEEGIRFGQRVGRFGGVASDRRGEGRGGEGGRTGRVEKKRQNCQGQKVERDEGGRKRGEAGERGQ